MKRVVILVTLLLTGCLPKNTPPPAPPPNHSSSVNARNEIKNLFETFFPEDLAKTKVTKKGVKLVIRNNILFKFNSYELTPAAKRFLRRLAYIYSCKILSRYPNSKLIIVGYTDDIGDENYNLQLSLKRAKSVKEFIESLDFVDIPPEKIIAVGKGEKDPIVPNTTKENRALNRRVEIYIDLGSNNEKD